jgi:hypothetical protein
MDNTDWFVNYFIHGFYLLYAILEKRAPAMSSAGFNATHFQVAMLFIIVH